jgi:hypothetical protein
MTQSVRKYSENLNNTQLIIKLDSQYENTQKSRNRANYVKKIFNSKYRKLVVGEVTELVQIFN